MGEVVEMLKKVFSNLRPPQKVALGFMTVILVGAILLNMPIATQSGERVGFLSALFTATTSTCVTGLIVVDTGTAFSLFGQIVILVLIQVGGLGFMTVATLLFVAMRKRITLKERMLIAESMNVDTMQGLVRLIFCAVRVTFLIEGVGALLLSIRMVPLFGIAKGIYTSVFLSISAFCNAGIDTLGNYQSITGFVGDGLVSGTIMALIILGGIGFALINEVWHKRHFKILSHHSRLAIVVTLILLVGGTAAFALMEWNNPQTMASLPVGDKLLASAFMSTTTRTAGFNSISIDGLTTGGKLLSCILMFIGAAPASTGGGIKVTTLACMVLAMSATIRGRRDTNLWKQRIMPDTIRRANAILMIALALAMVSTLVICALEPLLSLDAIMLDVFSALGTVGLSTGITPGLCNASKIILILLMYTGRVGMLTLWVAIAQRQKKMQDSIQYPPARIMVG